MVTQAPVFLHDYNPEYPKDWSQGLVARYNLRVYPSDTHSDIPKGNILG